MSSEIKNRRQVLLDILTSRDHVELRRWADEVRNPLRLLNSFLYNPDKFVCNRAAEAIGIISTIIAPDNLELLRKTLRHYFWTMNDESGNFCRFAPEAIGEILFNVPELISEYGHMLPPFLIEEPFEAGTRIAIARVALKKPDCFDLTIARQLIESLSDPDPAIRGSSINTLGIIGRDLNDARQRIEEMTDDESSFEMYNHLTGELKTVTVSEIAREFVATI